MKITLHDNLMIHSFAQLYDHTLRLLAAKSLHGRTTIVLGPMSPNVYFTYEENLMRMQSSIDRLSSEGWHVLDLVSFQPTVDRLISSLNICGYPFPVLEDFTLPLLRSGRFPTVHFMPHYEHSVGALREYQVARELQLCILNAWHTDY